MKKLMAILLTTLLLTIAICVTACAGSAYKVTLDINFIGNWFFSKYDVDLYLNDLKLETLPHGQDYKGSFYAEEGFSTLHFYEKGSMSVNGKIDLEITGNTTIKCTISCYNDRISVTDVKKQTEGPVVSRSNNEPEPIVTEKPTAEPAVTEEPTATPEPVTTESPAVEQKVETAEEVQSESEQERPIAEAAQPQSVSFADVDLKSMTDAELADALTAIKNEQRARIKTKIVLDNRRIKSIEGDSVRWRMCYCHSVL